jgi:hypothetical protein
MKLTYLRLTALVCFLLATGAVVFAWSFGRSPVKDGSPLDPAIVVRSLILLGLSQAGVCGAVLLLLRDAAADNRSNSAQPG